jgi:hypothetical protein
MGKRLIPYKMWEKASNEVSDSHLLKNVYHSPGDKARIKKGCIFLIVAESDKE